MPNQRTIHRPGVREPHRKRLPCFSAGACRQASFAAPVFSDQPFHDVTRPKRQPHGLTGTKPRAQTTNRQLIHWMMRLIQISTAEGPWSQDAASVAAWWYARTWKSHRRKIFEISLGIVLRAGSVCAMVVFMVNAHRSTCAFRCRVQGQKRPAKSFLRFFEVCSCDVISVMLS